MTEYKIRDAGDPRKYYTQIPNMIDDMDLSVHAYRLYGHLKRVAGEDGKCWQSVATLAAACHMSTGMITKAREELANSGIVLITRSKNPHGGKQFITITLVDVWSSNAIKYSTSLSEHATSPHEVATSYSEVATSPGEIKNNPIKNNSIRKLPAKAGVPKSDKANLFPIARALAAVTRMDFDKNKGRIFAEAKNYKPDDIEKIINNYSQGGVWYSDDWRGQKGQEPTLPQIRETWDKFTNDDEIVYNTIRSDGGVHV